MAGKGKIVRGALAALVDAYKKTFDPETYYHYSDSPDIKKFNPKAEQSFDSGMGGKPEPRGATYFTSDPKYADEIFDDYNEYLTDPTHPTGINLEDLLEGFNPTTYPVKIKTKDLFDFQNQKQVDDLINDLPPDPDLTRVGGVMNLWLRSGSWRFFENENIRKILKEKGYRGYRTSEPGTVALFNPDKGDVRSIFAKFDPKKSKSGNILASVPAGALATGALSELVEED